MKFNWKRNIKTRKGDRNALIFLATLLLGLYVYTFYYKPSSLEKEKLQPLEDILIPTDVPNKNKKTVTSAKRKIKKFREKKRKPKSKYPAIKNFKFDPNKLDSLEWLELGVRPWTIKTIKSYQAKGGQFRTCDDLGKIYNLPDTVFNRLSLYCDITSPPAKRPESYVSKYPARKEESDKIININVATQEELKSLWGIGPVISENILERRELLGGFHSINQLSDIWGVSDSVLLMNKKRIHITAPFRYININGSEDSLSRNYLINYNLAKLIVRYRMQHGDYQKIEDLKNLRTISDSTYMVLAPYLRLK